MSPFFLFRRKKYASGFKQRFGTIPNFNHDGRPVLWIHCVSVGEINAARPLINRILKRYPNYRLVVSTTTKTGQDLAQKLFGESADLVFYFPFDWQFTVNKVLDKIKPNIVLIMETELWLNFLRRSHRKGVRVVIVNGRLSEKSTKRYLWVKKTMKRTLRYVDLALMQSPEDAQRLMQLGIGRNQVKVTGNIKFDQQKENNERLLTSYFKERFKFSKDNPLIIAASTHEPEEKWILEAFKKIYKSDIPNLPRLMLVPRHPERFKEVGELIEKTGFSWTKRTSGLGFDDELADIVLLDSIGELRSVYPLADIVFVGGSLIPHGGQNILEPALERKTIITGHYMTNFQAIAKEFSERDAFVQLPQVNDNQITEKLAEALKELIENTELKRRLARNALSVVHNNRGATAKTFKHLKPLLQAGFSYKNNSDI